MPVPKKVSIKQAFSSSSHRFRRRLGDENALLPLSMLGIFTGLLAGLVIQAFRFFIEWPGAWMLGGSHESFENLDPILRMTLPIYGALALGLFLQFVIRNVPLMGVSHVIQRLNQHHGRLPMRATILQFFLGIWCVLTGQSTGREGPAVHLGAGVSSYIGQYWQLPNNSIRVLAGCGVASAIAASFNTPIAGVIFAMEVVMMEYTLAGFIPIMLAASSGAIISQIAYGTEPAFIVPVLEPHSYAELPMYILLGIGIGMASAVFCYLHQLCLRLHNLPLWTRITAAGAITGGIAYFFPEIMGIGYDTMNMVLEAQIGFYFLIAIGLAKIITSSISMGLGMPIGILAPTLFCGACLGGAAGIIINYFAPSAIANDSFYVMLGMGAMMGAVINAPLAALTALLELTNTPDIILPAMIAIVVATLTNTQVFKQKSPHMAALNVTGERTRLSVFELTLQRIGITSLMNTNVQSTRRTLSKLELLRLISAKPRWIIVEENNQPSVLLHGGQLEKGYADTEEMVKLDNEQDIDILAIPGEQLRISQLHFQASALEAWRQMDEENTDAAFITGTFDAYAPALSGIITRHDIDNYYHSPRNF